MSAGYVWDDGCFYCVDDDKIANAEFRKDREHIISYIPKNITEIDFFDDYIEEDEEEFSFEPIQETSIEVFEQVSEEPAPVDEIIDLDEEREETASGRLASLRSEIESGDRKPETREERMKRLFGDR